QQRLWFLHRLEPGSVEYNVPVFVRFDGGADLGALRAALAALVARHEVLRTRLVADEGGTPWQVVDPAGEVPVRVVDLRGEADPMPAAERVVVEELARPFDMAAEWLIRATVVRLSPGETALMLMLHHVASDEWSAAILRRELLALYAGETLAPLPVQYADFAVWQRQWLTGDVL
ncbi:condensation domain-containing protein, partial [Dactylosporangium siamense]